MATDEHGILLGVKQSDIEKCRAENMRLLLECQERSCVDRRQIPVVTLQALQTMDCIEAAKELVTHLNQSIKNDQMTLPELIAKAVELREPHEFEQNSVELEHKTLHRQVNLAERAIWVRQESIRKDEMQLKDIHATIESLWKQLHSLLHELHSLAKTPGIAC